MYIFAVHGFARASYEVVEGKRLDTAFELNVKGVTHYPSWAPQLIKGSITSIPTGSASVQLLLSYSQSYTSTHCLIFRPKSVLYCSSCIVVDVYLDHLIKILLFLLTAYSMHIEVHTTIPQLQYIILYIVL